MRIRMDEDVEISEKRDADAPKSLSSYSTVYKATAAGNIAGLIAAYKRRSGFWGYVGYFLVGGLLGSLVGVVISK
jgi:hypothetical protein